MWVFISAKSEAIRTLQKGDYKSNNSAEPGPKKLSLPRQKGVCWTVQKVG
jgi:hypothetical protein